MSPTWSHISILDRYGSADIPAGSSKPAIIQDVVVAAPAVVDLPPQQDFVRPDADTLSKLDLDVDCEEDQPTSSPDDEIDRERRKRVIRPPLRYRMQLMTPSPFVDLPLSGVTDVDWAGVKF